MARRREMDQERTADVAWGRGAMIAVTVLLLGAAACLALLAVSTLRISVDSGYYLPLARMTARATRWFDFGA